MASTNEQHGRGSSRGVARAATRPGRAASGSTAAVRPTSAPGAAPRATTTATTATTKQTAAATKPPTAAPRPAARPTASSVDEAPSVGKGRATPTRKEREAANRRPLVGNTPADRKAGRARLTDERDRARIGMANGEEKYLQPKDRGEQRRYVRDYIDARWGVGEAMMPVLVIVLLSSFVAAAAQGIALVLIWAFVGLFAIDTFVCWLLLRRHITAKWGVDTMQPRTFLYIVARSFQMRFLRLPKPQVKRGQYPS